MVTYPGLVRYLMSKPVVEGVIVVLVLLDRGSACTCCIWESKGWKLGGGTL